MPQSLGLTGWVRNEPDGSVLIVTEGEEENLNKLVQWYHEDSPSAVVDDVKVEKEGYKGEFEGEDWQNNAKIVTFRIIKSKSLE